MNRRLPLTFTEDPDGTWTANPQELANVVAALDEVKVTLIDLDKTLIPGHLGPDLMFDLLRAGKVRLSPVVGWLVLAARFWLSTRLGPWWPALLRVSALQFQAATLRLELLLPDQLAAEQVAALDARVAPKLRRELVELCAAARSRGHLNIMVTANSKTFAAVAQRLCGIPELIASEFDREAGLPRVLNVGPNKVTAVAARIEALGVGWSEVMHVADDDFTGGDRPLLDAAGVAVVVVNQRRPWWRRRVRGAR